MAAREQATAPAIGTRHMPASMQSRALQIRRACAFASVALVATSGCVNPDSRRIVDQVTAPPAGMAYEYALNIPEMNAESVFVSLRISGDCSAPASLVLPLVYFDNPVDSLSAPLVSDLSVSDADGERVRLLGSAAPVGPTQASLITIPSGTRYPVAIEYRARVNNVQLRATSHPVAPVYIEPRHGFMVGAYLFAVPYQPLLVDLWRNPLDISLVLDLGPGISISGISAGTTTYRNAYELLLTQLALGSLAIGAGTGGSLAFEVRVLGDYRPPPARLDFVLGSFAGILDSLLPVYGKPSADVYPVFLRDVWGGLEGTSSFTCLYPDTVEDGVVAMVLAHEMIHDAVGIRCGDYDDPWWKEGVTTYLAWAAAARLGMTTGTRFHQWVIAAYDSSATLPLYAPSSTTIRDYLFSGNEDVAYGKGAHIAMCLDLAVRRSTNNGIRLDEVVAALAARYDGGAFTRRELKTHFLSHGRTDISGILSMYADRSGAIPRPVLDSTFSALESLGAFGDAGPGKARATWADRTRFVKL